MFHEQAASAITSTPVGIVQHFPTSVLLNEQRVEYRSLMQMLKEERTLQGTVNWRQMEMEGSVLEQITDNDSDEYIKEFEQLSLKWPCLWHLLSMLLPREDASSSLILRSPNPEHIIDIESLGLVVFTKKALSASKQAALLVQDSTFFGIDIDESTSPGLGPTSLADSALEKKKRLTQLLDGQSRRRKMSKLKVMDPKTCSSRKADLERKKNEEFDHNDPLQLFLRGPESKQLLTFEEEYELFIQIQGLMRLEEVKSRLQSQFDREPTLVEWTEAAGLRCRVLQSQLSSGNCSRERLINANHRMVVHIAKQYQGRGISLWDLLQEGSMGLIKSAEKFKPQAGCRFSTYAYWWIRHAIRRPYIRIQGQFVYPKMYMRS